jgi:hypothetical protein
MNCFGGKTMRMLTRLTRAVEVRDLNVDKLFKITKLNLKGRDKEWFKRLQPTPTIWAKDSNSVEVWRR